MDRQQLHDLLKSIIGSGGKVYFQPGTNTTMAYPCIVYQRDMADTKFADNSPYRHTKRYSVTYIDQNPDSEVYDKIANLPMCLFERHFTAEDLNHDVFNLYF
jgi:hypothetical protein